MPVDTCLSDLFAIRFDFGVPLEDIFPQNDIHPRLKYLFHKAFESYSEHRSDIEYILKYGQGTVNDCLALKETLVLDKNYRSNIEGNLPGTYFWLIRHFMGLLPLPLFPNYTNGIEFDWNSVANECKIAFKACDHRERNRLDYDIAQCLNILPIENVILINIFMKFIRKICMRTVGGHHKFNRSSLIAISKYFCSSLFVRPYQPGHPRKSEYQVLLLYLILRWHNITEHCHSIGHPTNFLESKINYKRDANIQTSAFFNPDVITVCRNIPFFRNKYVKDSACQTETDLLSEKVNDDIREDNSKFRNAYTLAYIEEVLDEECELAITNPDEDCESAIKDHDDELKKHDDEDAGDNTFYQTAYDITFNNILDEEKKTNWNKIVKETMQVVKKVEESYIYDDYETFEKEEFNQIGNDQSKTGSFLSKIGRRSLKKCSTPKNVSPAESENSYVKYPDVFDSDNGSQKSINSGGAKSDLDEIQLVDNKSKMPIAAPKLSETNTSPCSGEDADSKTILKDKNLKKISRQQYFFKRIRLSLEFLRTLTPKKSTFRLVESKVKYQRMKRGKSNTI